MNALDLKLNDFDSFDRLIFRGREPNWSKLYNPKTDTFYPPIPHPKSEVECQLDHYALWMVIAHHDLTGKPNLFRRRGFHPRNVLIPGGRCYACQYHEDHYNNSSCGKPEYPCPLTSADGHSSCGLKWELWRNLCICSPNEGMPRKKAAIDIAHIKWRELT